MQTLTKAGLLEFVKAHQKELICGLIKDTDAWAQPTAGEITWKESAKDKLLKATPEIFEESEDRVCVLIEGGDDNNIFISTTFQDAHWGISTHFYKAPLEHVHPILLYDHYLFVTFS